jgi:exodeoxyribonuclease V alpha subunit
VELQTNYRFGAESGIYALSRLVNAGDASGSVELLAGRRHSDLAAVELPASASLLEALREPVLSGFRSFLEPAEPLAALQRFSEFRILAALRRGPFGVENLNRLVEQILAEAGLIEPGTQFYRGRPVLVRRNDPQLQLFNGDIGLLLQTRNQAANCARFFPGSDGGIRRVLPGRLPVHETGFAMTVHKSQGSEFGRVLVVLPPEDHPVCTRELLYTALTRARTHVELWSREPALRAAIQRRTERASGLPAALSAGS